MVIAIGGMAPAGPQADAGTGWQGDASNFGTGDFRNIDIIQSLI